MIYTNTKTYHWLAKAGLKKGEYLNKNWHAYDARLAAWAIRFGWLELGPMKQTGPTLLVRIDCSEHS